MAIGIIMAATMVVNVAVDNTMVVVIKVITKIWDQETLPSATKRMTRQAECPEIMTIIVIDVDHQTTRLRLVVHPSILWIFIKPP